MDGAEVKISECRCNLQVQIVQLVKVFDYYGRLD